MFSGIVEALGRVAALIPEPPGCRLVIDEPMIRSTTKVADSISVNGCCLTVVETGENTMTFQAGPETLARTNLGELVAGSPVNLERALAVGDRLGGHFVSGHIDGQGELVEIRDYFPIAPNSLTSRSTSAVLSLNSRRVSSTKCVGVQQ